MRELTPASGIAEFAVSMSPSAIVPTPDESVEDSAVPSPRGSLRGRPGEGRKYRCLRDAISTLGLRLFEISTLRAKVARHNQIDTNETPRQKAVSVPYFREEQPVSTTTESVATAQRGLDRFQLGHIKHFEQMSKRQPGDWSGMQGIAATQGDDFNGYRFQLAYAAYALALAHKHRLPNAPAMFQSTFQRLIEKLRRADVWMYWRDISRGGSMFNAHLAEQYTEQWDPVAQDNIMYSAYLQSVPAMYNVLFDDDRYAQPGALSLQYNSFLWGGGIKTFEYDQNSLTSHIYWKMVESGFMGIACEPNCLFQICNQPAIIGFRMQDLADGGSVAEEVVAGYRKAYEDFGHLDEDGHYHMMVLEDSKTMIPMKEAWVDGWAGTLMNTWNRDFVRENYPRQIADYLIEGPDGTLSVAFQPLNVGDGLETLDNDWGNFGWSATWASEMGDTKTLDGLLAHADRFMKPTWQDGALYYPRNDQPFDQDGHLTSLGVLTGNTLLGYARLNVQDGMWGLYNEPWDRTHFAEPLIVERSDDVDITKAVFDRDSRTLDFATQVHGGEVPAAFIEIDNVDGDFQLQINEQVVTDPSVLTRDQARLRIRVPAELADMTLTVPDWRPSP